MSNFQKVKSSRVVYLDYLRIIAAFFIVVIHVSTMNWSDLSPNSTEWSIKNIYDGISRFGVPVFVMISGSLFLDREYTYKQLFKKHILKIAVIFLLWSAFYAVVPYIRHKEMLTPQAVVGRMFDGHSHLWFLIMLIGLYLIVPFLRKIAEHEALAKAFVALAFVFGFMLPQIIELTALASKEAADVLKGFSEALNLKFIMGYTGYYILGYMLRKKFFKKSSLALIAIAGVLGMAVTVGGTALISTSTGKVNTLFYSYLSVNVFLTSVAVFALGKAALDFTPKTDKGAERLGYLSKCSFGVYLIHPMLIVVLENGLKFSISGSASAFLIPIVSLTVFAGSYLISMVLNKIPVVNKWLV